MKQAENEKTARAPHSKGSLMGDLDSLKFEIQDEIPGGTRIKVIGVGGGAQIDLNLFSLMGRRARIGGSTLRVRSRADKAAVAAAVAKHVLPLLADGRLRVPVCDTFAMAEAEAAYARFREGAKLGKVVLVNE